MLSTVMEDQILKIPPFECDNVPMSELRQRWFDYKKQFEYIAEAMSKKKKRKLKNIFLAVAGRQLQRIYESLPEDDEDNPGDGEERVDDFTKVIRKLDGYFAPKRHDTFERYSFWSQKPAAGETLDRFLLRAKILADKCQFGTTERESKEAAVIDKIVMLAPPELRRKILEKPTLNLDDLTKLVNTHLSVQHQIRELGQHAPGTGNVFDASRGPVFVNKISSNNGSRWPQVQAQDQATEECGRCGYKMHNSDEDCPARKVKCHLCNYLGHFAKKCKSTSKKRNVEAPESRKRKFEAPADYRNHHRPKVSRVNAIGDQASPVLNSEQAEHHGLNSFIYAISDNHDEMIWCKVGHVLIEMMIDSGSKHNIIDERTWNYMQEKSAVVNNVRPSNKHLSAYAQRGSLDIICTFDADIAVVEGKDRSFPTSFYVVKGGEQNLLGRDTAKQLGVLLIGLPSVTNIESVQHVSENAVEKFPVIKGSSI